MNSVYYFAFASFFWMVSAAPYDYGLNSFSSPSWSNFGSSSSWSGASDSWSSPSLGSSYGSSPWSGPSLASPYYFDPFQPLNTGPVNTPLIIPANNPYSRPVVANSIYDLPNGVYGPEKPTLLGRLFDASTATNLDMNRALFPKTIKVTDKYINIKNDNGYHQTYNKETGAWKSYTGF
jgi:hypothetical protein